MREAAKRDVGNSKDIENVRLSTKTTKSGVIRPVSTVARKAFLGIQGTHCEIIVK
jgi:hypothetical protein